MTEDGGTQVVHHPLAHLVREQRLRDADHAARDRDQDHAAREIREERGVPGRDCGVQDLLQEERRDHAEAGGEDDQREHRGEAAAVRPEEMGDPVQVRTAHGGVLRALRRLELHLPAVTGHSRFSVRRRAHSRA